MGDAQQHTETLKEHLDKLKVKAREMCAARCHLP